MTRELACKFNEEVERYRRALLYFAAACDWEQFKARAERLFEYLEDIEARERERRFYAVFYGILAALALGVLILLGIGSRLPPAWLAYRHAFLFLSLAGCGFELFFYVNFRRYVEVRMAGYERRRERFIRGIESDFRSFQVS
jgi:hypothetical protein